MPCLSQSCPVEERKWIKLSELAISTARLKHNWKCVENNKIKLQNSKCDILNKKKFVREVKKIWVGLTPAYIQSLYNSIPRRIRSVIVAKGHITKYWKWQVCKINLKNIFPIFPYAYIPQVTRWRPSWWNNYGHLLYIYYADKACRSSEISVDLIIIIVFLISLC